MNEKYYSLITHHGEQAIAQAIADKAPLPLKTMAIGDGNGTPTTPDANQTELQREVYRAEITDLLQDGENQVIAELLVPEEVGGFTVREVGIYDDQNKLVAVANCPENYKPVLEQGSGKVQYYRIVLRVSSKDAVTLSISNNIVYATRVELDNLVNNLGKPDGFKLVGQCESIDELRTIEPTEDQQRILVKSYYAGKNIGGGVFYADLSDTATEDNGGTVILTPGKKCWKRIAGNLSLYDFGCTADGENALFAVNNAEKAKLGEYIDCCGLTVDMGGKYPVNNKYTNGNFIINGIEVWAQYNNARTGIGRFVSGSRAAENLKSSEWTGNDVIAIGEKAMESMQKCVSGIAIGKRAQGTSIVSRDNIAIGGDALYQVQAETEWYSQDKKSGTRNIAIGGTAGRGITSGYGNTVIGRGAGQNLSNGNLNVALGAGAIGGAVPVGFSGDIEHHFPSGARASVAIGAAALNQYVASSEGVAIGGYAAEKMKKGLYNTAIGFGALRNLEADIAPNGGQILWTGTQAGSYSQSGNIITLTFGNLHGAEAGYIVGVRLLDGAIKTLMNDVVPAKVLIKNGNSITVESPKSLSATGAAELNYVYSNDDVGLNTNQNTAMGYAALNGATRANYSVAIGTSALKLGNNISGAVAVGASAFEYGTHSNSVGIGRSVAGQANTTNSVIIGARTMGSAKTINDSIVIGCNLNPAGEQFDSQLAIGAGINGDLIKHRYGVNIPLTEKPLANLHIRPKDSKGSGRTSTVDGVLVEHSGVAVTKVDGGTGADLDFEIKGVTKFGFRYRTSNNLTTIITNNEHSWKIDNNHIWFPDRDNRNGFGNPNRRLKEIYIAEPDKEETGDKVITAKWFRNQFSHKLTAQNGWRVLPNGEIEQWGTIDFPQGVNNVWIDFPIAFNECFFIVPIDITNTSSADVLSVGERTVAGCRIISNRSAGGIQWFAKGK